jgi:UDP-2-acetamido-3-amino-2,3-dideoxy-glucuronate N-acetyltransferase
MATIIHPSAVVDEGATLGEGTRVWHFSHVAAGARIGARCTLGQNVFVAGSVVVGDGVKIQNNVSLYDGVQLEDEVFCGPGAVFTNVKNPRAKISRKHEYRRTLVRHGATLGANCTILCGVTVGRYAFVGAGAVLDRNAPDFGLMLGVPARLSGWMSRYGERLDLPLAGDGEARCPHTGDRYTLRAGVCSLDNHDRAG